MGFLTFLGIASSIAYGLTSEAKSGRYKHNKQAFLESINYDVDVKRDFANICAVNGVKPFRTDQFLGVKCNENPPIWPKDGYMKCLSFLEEQPKLTNEDIDLFIELYNAARQKSLDKMQEKSDEYYEMTEKGFRKTEIPTKLVIYEKNEWIDLSVEEVQVMADNMYNNTFWGEVATGPAKVLKDGHKTREIWQVRDYGKILLNNYYIFCKEKSGYLDV